MAAPNANTRKLRARVDKLGLAREVRFIGEAYNRAKREFFEGINLLAVPSHTENFAMVVAEALASGMPVIASRGTPWARLEEEGCGLWLENSPAALAQALERMREAPLPRWASGAANGWRPISPGAAPPARCAIPIARWPMASAVRPAQVATGRGFRARSLTVRRNNHNANRTMRPAWLPPLIDSARGSA